VIFPEHFPESKNQGSVFDQSVDFHFSKANIKLTNRKIDLATESQPPYCGIRSVSSREHVCWQFQPTRQRDLIEIEDKYIKNPRTSIKAITNVKNEKVGGRDGSLGIRRTPVGGAGRNWGSPANLQNLHVQGTPPLPPTSPIELLSCYLGNESTKKVPEIVQKGPNGLPREPKRLKCLLQVLPEASQNRLRNKKSRKL
jgi:hypothetical protein